MARGQTGWGQGLPDSRYQMTIVVHRRDRELELGWWWLKNREVFDRTAERDLGD